MKVGAGTRKINHHPGWKAAETKIRRDAAMERQAERDKLTPSQQIARLDRILGVGVGATRERAKLNKIISGGAK